MSVLRPHLFVCLCHMKGEGLGEGGVFSAWLLICGCFLCFYSVSVATTWWRKGRKFGSETFLAPQ